MITKDNIQKVLLDLKFFSNHGVYTDILARLTKALIWNITIILVNSIIR